MNVLFIPLALISVFMYWVPIECVRETNVSVRVCMPPCMTEGDILFFSLWAFNLLFLNLPPLSVLCCALPCPRFESEWASALVHPTLLSQFVVNVRRERSERRCQIRRRSWSRDDAIVHFPSACHSTSLLAQTSLRSPVIQDVSLVWPPTTTHGRMLWDQECASLG